MPGALLVVAWLRKRLDLGVLLGFGFRPLRARSSCMMQNLAYKVDLAF